MLMPAHYGDMKAQLEITAFFPRLFLFVGVAPPRHSLPLIYKSLTPWRNSKHKPKRMYHCKKRGQARIALR